MEAHGVKVFIEPMALLNVIGTVMDYEETELASEFTFNNPNSKGECGCGESFNVWLTENDFFLKTNVIAFVGYQIKYRGIF